MICNSNTGSVYAQIQLMLPIQKSKCVCCQNQRQFWQLNGSTCIWFSVWVVARSFFFTIMFSSVSVLHNLIYSINNHLLLSMAYLDVFNILNMKKKIVAITIYHWNHRNNSMNIVEPFSQNCRIILKPFFPKDRLILIEKFGKIGKRIFWIILFIGNRDLSRHKSLLNHIFLLAFV